MSFLLIFSAALTAFSLSSGGILNSCPVNNLVDASARLPSTLICLVRNSFCKRPRLKDGYSLKNQRFNLIPSSSAFILTIVTPDIIFHLFYVNFSYYHKDNQSFFSFLLACFSLRSLSKYSIRFLISRSKPRSTGL